MCILNTEGCNIFENFESDEYSEVLDLLRNNILATDLACHFRNREKQQQMARDGYDKDDPRQRKLLFELFMSCCDLSDQTKDWKVVKKTAVSSVCWRSIYNELTIYANDHKWILFFYLGGNIWWVFYTRRLREKHGQPACRNDGQRTCIYSWSSDTIHY